MTDELVGAIESGRYDFIVANYANPDMVGHTGVWDGDASPRSRRSTRCLGPRRRRRRARRGGRSGRSRRRAAGHRRPRQRRRAARRRRATPSRRTRSTPCRCSSPGRSVRGRDAPRRRPRRRRARRSSSSPGCRAGTGMTGRSLLESARGAVAARTSATIRGRHPPEVNPPVNPILAIGQILLSIALIAAILLQARGTGLSGTFGGDSAVYRSRRGIERRLWQFTIVLLVLFILFALVSFVPCPPRRLAGPAGRRAQAQTSLDPAHQPMPITRRDNAVVVVLVLSLVVLGGVIAMPAPAPAAATPEPTPELDAAAPGHVPRGRRRRPGGDHAGRARARRSERTLVGLDLQRPRPARSRQHLRARPRRVVDDRRQGQDLDVHAPRRRDVAGRRAGDGATTSCTPSRRSRIPRPSGAMAGAWADVTATAVDPQTVELTVATPIAGFLAAATQPLLPAHLLSDVPVRRPRDEPVRRRRRWAPGRIRSSSSTTPHARAAARRATARPGATPPSGPTPSLDSLGTPAPTSTPALALPYLERIELHFFDDDDRGRRRVRGGRGRRGRRARRPPSRPRWPPTPPSTASATRRRRSRPSCSTSARRIPSCATRASARRCSARIDRDAIVRRRWAATGSAADTLVPPVSWAFDAKAAAPVAYDAKAATKLLNEAGWKKKNGAWTAKDGKAPYKLELLTVPADGEPAAWRRWRPPSPGPGRTSGSRPRSSRRPRPTSPRSSAPASSPRPRWTSRWASSRTSIRCSPRARCAAPAPTCRGYQDPALDALLETARKPGTPDGPDDRVAGAAHRPGRAPAPAADRLAQRRRAVTGGRRDPPRGSSRVPGTGSGMC